MMHVLGNLFCLLIRVPTFRAVKQMLVTYRTLESELNFVLLKTGFGSCVFAGSVSTGTCACYL